MHVAAGGRRFSWTFLLADVALPIIGADFLKHFQLLVDLGEMGTWGRLESSPGGAVNKWLICHVRGGG